MAIKERQLPKDINSMTLEEISAYLQDRKEQETRERHQKAIKAKAELEAYCQEKYGLSLAQVYTASDKPPSERKQYKHPETGEIWAYSGRGKVAAWAKGPDGKPNPDYEVTNVRDLGLVASQRS
ncbi:hypothetical protein [Bradyrhizobium sp. 149]|uniref:hypothetical protein n=1 Tax=Bradyrhizobium sp. 149 TaxID=2782624 RepID=UPI001FF7F6DE|nr:hypothetical protein [Bradyrhizobium sp. 149]